MGVVVGGAARCPSSEAEMHGSNTLGITRVSALGSSEASAPQGLKCISIMEDSNGGSTTVRSRGGVLSREGPFSEVPLYWCIYPTSCNVYIGRKAWIRTFHGCNCAKRGSLLRADNPWNVPRTAHAA